MTDFHISPEDFQKIQELAESRRQDDQATPFVVPIQPVMNVQSSSATDKLETSIQATLSVPLKSKASISRFSSILWFLGGIYFFFIVNGGSYHLFSTVIYPRFNPGPLLRDMGHDEVFYRIRSDKMDDLPSGRSDEWQDWVGHDRIWNQKRQTVSSGVGILIGLVSVTIYYAVYQRVTAGS